MMSKVDTLPYIRRSGSVNEIEFDMGPFSGTEEYDSDDGSEEKLTLDNVNKKWNSNAGLIWYLEVLADDYINPKHCLPSGELKACRPLPQIRASKFFDSVVRRETEYGVVYIYEGEAINGWGQLKGPLQLCS